MRYEHIISYIGLILLLYYSLLTLTKVRDSKLKVMTDK